MMQTQETHTDPDLQATENTVDHASAAPAIEARIAELEQALAEMKNQWLRAVAEGENTRKRSEREMQDARKYAASEFARDMVGVAENLKRATDSIPQDQIGQAGSLLNTIYSGVEMTLKELLGTFERHGVKRIDPKGQAFDHNLHQAVAQVEDASVASGHVAQVIQAGYTMHDRLLMPAMVAVAKPPAAPVEHVDTTA